jgi:glycosyltransferase involved in cell wall biosynthesis
VFEEKKGYGNAIRGGLAKAQGKWIGWTDGDRQIDSEDVLKVILKTKEMNAIFCKAERRIREDGILRRFITFNYRLFISVLLRKWTYDVNGKPKFFLRSWYDHIHTESTGWFIDAELMYEFLRRGAKIINQPITFHQRKKGKSSVSIKSLMKVIKEFSYFLFHSYFKKREKIIENQG